MKSIQEQSSNDLVILLERLRRNVHNAPSLEKITKEVEIVRLMRYNKSMKQITP